MASKAGSLAAVSLIIASWIVSFVMFGKVAELKDELVLARRESTLAPAPVNETATINFYLREHQDIIAQQLQVIIFFAKNLRLSSQKPAVADRGRLPLSIEDHYEEPNFGYSD